MGTIGWDAHGNPIEQGAQPIGWDADGNPLFGQPRQQPAQPQRTPWNARETAAVRDAYMRRHAVQDVIPMGAAIEPMVAAITDPRQRAAIGRNISNVIDQARQLPNLNLSQLANDVGAAGQRAWADLPNLPGRILTHLPQIIEGATTAPFTANEDARNQEVVQVLRGNEAGANQAAGQAVNATGGIATNMAGGILGPLARTPLQGAALAAGLTAPNALAQQPADVPLQQRLPQAIVDTAGAGAIGAALPLLARNAPRRTPSGAAVIPEEGAGAMHGMASNATPASRLADFETAGVNPTLAATVQGTPASMTKTISENWLGGLTARSRLHQSIAQTAERARELAGRIGPVQDPELAGEAVQAGVRRFAQARELPPPHAGDPRTIPVRDWSFPAKAEAMYNRVFDQLENDEAAMTGHVDSPVVTVDNTLRTIGEMSDSVRGNESRDIIGAPTFLRQMHDALQTDAQNGSLSFRDLRTWRTALRDRMSDPGLRGDTSSGQLSHVYDALTQDIGATARNIGGQAAVDLPKIDRWYRAGSQRIENALEPFNRAGGGMGGGRQAYRRIIALASRGPQQNSQQLRALASSLRPDEMRTVGATLLDEMGAPTPGRPGALEPGAFSAATFATNWARLSEAGKNALFPPALRRELDALARVADYQREVEAMANHSMTAVRTQNLAVTGGAALAVTSHNPLAIAGAAGVIGAMNLTGEMLTNPRFVRWLTHAAQARADGASAGRALAELRRIAARDPAIIPAYNDLLRAQRGSAPDQQEQQPAMSQAVQ